MTSESHLVTALRVTVLVKAWPSIAPSKDLGTNVRMMVVISSVFPVKTMFSSKVWCFRIVCFPLRSRKSDVVVHAFRIPVDAWCLPGDADFPARTHMGIKGRQGSAGTPLFPAHGRTRGQHALPSRNGLCLPFTKWWPKGLKAGCFCLFQSLLLPPSGGEPFRVRFVFCVRLTSDKKMIKHFPFLKIIS